MRLIIPVVIIILGMLVGAAVCSLFRQADRCFRASIVAGALGAFTGLITRDALDISAGGPALGAFISAVLGAVLLSVLANAYFKFVTGKH